MPEVFSLAAEVRTLVAFLAEQRAAWFQSQFFGARASSFLAPVFARTAFQAQVHGVTAAACRLHDEGIGLGRTHHLFRLPEVFEQGIASALTDRSFVEALKQRVATQEAALLRLEELAIAGSASDGALAMEGNLAEGAKQLLRSMAGLYLNAFQKGIKSYPFVRGG